MRPSYSLLPGAILVLVGACSGGSGDLAGPDAGANSADASTGADADPSDALFAPDHVLEINISLADADWAELRVQPDSIALPKVTCGNQPTEHPYDYFAGEVTIDGVTTSNVGIRKKGGFGSITSERPGLKIKASEYVQGQRIFGSKSLTLNNNHQDDTYISQCLGYALFRNAGVPASRCSFAHVTVNGEDLGLYSNVESINKPMLRRHFDDDTGQLYESGGEFAAGGTNGFQPKDDALPPDCSDLPPIADALDAPASELLDTLGALVDIDAFMTYWAMEVIMDHWDGYANNRNNYFFYHDPGSDKIQMIPWGIDALFGGRERSTRPKSVFACGRMAWRLYDAPATQALYLTRLQELLATVWDEDAILAEIARMEILIAPIVDPGNRGELSTALQPVRDFVSGRSAELMAELEQGPPVWPYAENESCLISLGTVSGSFDTSWDTLDNFAAGTGTMAGTISGTVVDSTTGFTSAGLNEENKAVVQVAVQLPDNSFAVVLLVVHDPTKIQPGTLPIDLVTAFSVMAFYDPVTATSYGGGLVLNGSVTFTSAATTADAPIIGSFIGEVFEI